MCIWCPDGQSCGRHVMSSLSERGLPYSSGLCLGTTAPTGPCKFTTEEKECGSSLKMEHQKDFSCVCLCIFSCCVCTFPFAVINLNFEYMFSHGVLLAIRPITGWSGGTRNSHSSLFPLHLVYNLLKEIPYSTIHTCLQACLDCRLLKYFSYCLAQYLTHKYLNRELFWKICKTYTLKNEHREQSC